MFHQCIKQGNKCDITFHMLKHLYHIFVLNFSPVIKCWSWFVSVWFITLACSFVKSEIVVLLGFQRNILEYSQLSLLWLSATPRFAVIGRLACIFYYFLVKRSWHFTFFLSLWPMSFGHSAHHSSDLTLFTFICQLFFRKNPRLAFWNVCFQLKLPKQTNVCLFLVGSSGRRLQNSQRYLQHVFRETGYGFPDSRGDCC